MVDHAKQSTVKWFWSRMQGAPYPTGSTTANDVIRQIWQKCLVEGFNSLTFDSLTVLNGIATASRSSGHGYLTNSIVNVTGATPSGLNGDKRVLAVTMQTITFDATGISDQTATGTITIKQAPAGWSSPFSDSNNYVVRPAESSNPRSFFRLNNGNPSGSRVFRPVYCYEDMTDAVTGTNQWAAQGQFDSYPAAPASLSTGYVAGEWMCIADERTAYFWGTIYTLAASLAATGIGDFASFLSGDVKNDFVWGTFTDATITSSRYYACPGLWCHPSASYPQDSSFCRLHATAGGAVGPYGIGLRMLNDMSGMSGGTAFPSPIDNGLLLADALLREWTNDAYADGSLRGKVRGAYWCLQSIPGTTKMPGLIITGVSGLEGRQIMLMPYQAIRAGYGQPPTEGRVAIDITGPWE